MENKTGYVADFPSEIIKEGKVQILVPKLAAYGVVPSDYAPSKAPVFYNPVMEFNRDLSVLTLKAYQHMVNHEISICEPFTSQGIRGIRFAVEIDGVTRVMLSDINTSAVDLAKYNIELNKMENKITLEHKDANAGFVTIESDNIEITEGLGFLTDVIIDQHFIKRQRLNRLVAASIENPDELCVGIDESTAIIVDGDFATVTGIHQVIVIKNTGKVKNIKDGKLGTEGLQLSVYVPGQKFKLR